MDASSLKIIFLIDINPDPYLHYQWKGLFNMANVGTYEQLCNKSDEALILQFDTISKHTEVGLSFLREELVRRERERQHKETLDLTRQMHGMTRQMSLMTFYIAILTTVNVLAILAVMVW